MPDKSIYDDSNDNLNEHWEAFRKKDLSNSFPHVADWLRENVKRRRLYKSQHKRSVHKGWLMAAIIPLLLILTCAFKVDRKERFGDLINFGLEKTAVDSYTKVTAIQRMFGFTFHQVIESMQPRFTRFVALVRNDGKTIAQQLASLDGVSDLKTTEIKYTVRESIFSSFIHETLNVGNSPKPRTAEVEQLVEHELARQGLAHIDIAISPDAQQDLIINSIKADQLTIESANQSSFPDTAMRGSSAAKSLGQKSSVEKPEIRKLEDFEWLLGTWKLLYVPVETYHHWIRISDTVLKCYILEKPDGKANLTTGFYLKNGYLNETELHLKTELWKFTSTANKVYTFISQEDGDRANVTWTLKDDDSWQCQVFGRRNKEFMNFARDQNLEVEELVKLMRKNHPDKDTKY